MQLAACQLQHDKLTAECAALAEQLQATRTLLQASQQDAVSALTLPASGWQCSTTAPRQCQKAATTPACLTKAARTAVLTAVRRSPDDELCTGCRRTCCGTERPT